MSKTACNTFVTQKPLQATDYAVTNQMQMFQILVSLLGVYYFCMGLVYFKNFSFISNIRHQLSTLQKVKETEEPDCNNNNLSKYSQTIQGRGNSLDTNTYSHMIFRGYAGKMNTYLEIKSGIPGLHSVANGDTKLLTFPPVLLLEYDEAWCKSSNL